jgi:hypothetical protein
MKHIHNQAELEANRAAAPTRERAKRSPMKRKTPQTYLPLAVFAASRFVNSIDSTEASPPLGFFLFRFLFLILFIYLMSHY